MAQLVFNIEPASPSMIRSLDRHCLNRVPDGVSAIDPNRSDCNRVLVGSEDGVLASLEAFYASGIKRPAKQSESPYLRIVASASPSYFRPVAPDLTGTWNEARLREWLDATMDHLKDEFGDDLVFVHLHLDEDTPHVHAVIAPTYEKKARMPGRKKRNETDEGFTARKREVAAKASVQTVGRASHPTLSRKGSFQQLRERMAIAVQHLGIEYGEDRSIDAPGNKPTREWVKEKALQNRKEAARNRRERAQIAADREKLAEEKARAGDLHDQLNDLTSELAQKKTTVQNLTERRNSLRLKLPI
jgi:hypothetical protein